MSSRSMRGIKASRSTPNYIWPTWGKPDYHMERKPSFDEIRKEFEKLGGRPQ